MSYVRPSILCGSEPCCLKECVVGILRRSETSMAAKFGVQLKDRKRSKDFILMLSLNEALDQLAMTNSVCLYGHVLRREDGHVLRRALDFEVVGQRKKGWPKRTWKKEVNKKKCDCWFENCKCTLPVKVECWR